jgi:hypothetical protein
MLILTWRLIVDSQGDLDAVRDLELILLEETGPRYIVVCKSPSETL